MDHKALTKIAAALKTVANAIEMESREVSGSATGATVFLTLVDGQLDNVMDKLRRAKFGARVTTGNSNEITVYGVDEVDVNDGSVQLKDSVAVTFYFGEDISRCRLKV